MVGLTTHSPQRFVISVNETAMLASTSVRKVRKMIEEDVVKTRRLNKPVFGRAHLDLLQPTAVPLISLFKDVDIELSPHRKRMMGKFVLKYLENVNIEPFFISAAFRLDEKFLADRVPGPFESAMQYCEVRDNWIVRDPEILGGAPVIKGTRVTAHSILGRLDGGDSMADLIEDNPHIEPPVLAMAAQFAKANPLRGRPSDRPWRAAA